MLSGCGQNQICPPLLWQMFGADHFSQGVFVGSVEAPCQPFTGSSLPCRQMSLCSGSQSRLSPQPLESQHFPSTAGASVGMNLSKSHSVPLLHGINLHPAPSPQPRGHGPLGLYQLCDRHPSLLPFSQTSVCHSFLSRPRETPSLNMRQK